MCVICRLEILKVVVTVYLCQSTFIFAEQKIHITSVDNFLDFMFVNNFVIALWRSMLQYHHHVSNIFISMNTAVCLIVTA